MASQALSISAWNAVLDWPSTVAPFSTCRQGPASSSAALRKTAARSCHAMAPHSRRASRAAEAASATSPGPAWWKRASTWPCRWGMRTSATLPVRISLPPTTTGISTSVAAMRARLALSAALSGDPGA